MNKIFIMALFSLLSLFSCKGYDKPRGCKVLILST